MKKRKKQQKIKRKYKIWIWVGAVVCLLVVGGGIFSLRWQRLDIEAPERVYIPAHSTFDAVVDSLDVHNCLSNKAVFSLLAKVRGYSNHIKGGSYVFQPQMGILQVFAKLNSGNQDPVRITINRHRTKASLCQYLERKLELDADSLLLLLNTDSVCAHYMLDTNQIIGIFCQNTYEVYWNISPRRLLDRMFQEYNRFWNEKRMGQCAELQLSQGDVVTLASIVDEETNNNEEKPTIASVYLNRLRKGMLLQADPTLKYSVGDFTLRRLTAKQMASDSPYNTYRNKGLPPGPICIPSVASIDAVLDNLRTDYLYFCAKEDFSGSHNFAATLAEHQRNAARFHQALNRRNIYK